MARRHRADRSVSSSSEDEKDKIRTQKRREDRERNSGSEEEAKHGIRYSNQGRNPEREDGRRTNGYYDESGRIEDDRTVKRQRHGNYDDEGDKSGRKEMDLDSDNRKDRRRDKEREREKIQDEDESKEESRSLKQDEGDGRENKVPSELARMMKDVQDKSSIEYQRMTWDALRKSINGLVNKANATNLKNIIPELFSQMASPGFTDVFAALVALVNTKFPEVGDLLLRRIILQLQRPFKRNAHLVNRQVVHELIALELPTLLLEKPTDDSVEVAVSFVRECGSILQDLSPRGLHGIFERFRAILHEGEIDKRVQYLIEGLFAVRKAKFQGHPAVRPVLDLVDQEDQLTHEVSFRMRLMLRLLYVYYLNCQLLLIYIFKPDAEFPENEKRYEELKNQILGEESEEETGSDGDSDADSDDEDGDESEEENVDQMKIKVETETNLINLRRTIYLTIMSSVDFEEAGHKLLKIILEPGQEMELCIMLLECCSQERTYLRYYGLLGQRFCMINKIHQVNFGTCFVQLYSMIHRLETNKLRNVAKFFAHLLGTDALPWHVLSSIRLTEEDTTSSSRIFIKILFRMCYNMHFLTQELSEHLGIRLLNECLSDPAIQESFDSIFPKDNPKNTRFAINFFTSIGLGGITENLREYLKNMPQLIMQQQKAISEPDAESDSSSSKSDSSESESSSLSSDSSDSDDTQRKKRRRHRA
ncbi:hypothetical protein ACJIZ3_016966 [Penstemon smallii]|uniref:MI domain-containing protein n=1 Tax=Penstemon smallii TaxID=265156 RepID=A0ABD3SU84_9LAMI